jgi:PAS domain S-box-containing protein
VHIIDRSGIATSDDAGPRSAPLALVIDDLPDGVLVATRDGRIELANPAFLELTARSADQVLGWRLEALVAEEDMLTLVGFQAMFGESSTRDNHVLFLSADGERRSLIVGSSRSRDERHVIMTARAAGTLQQALADESRWAAAEQQRALELREARDALAAQHAALSLARAQLEQAYTSLQAEVTRRERLQTELRLAQKLESIGQLSAGIAHEINTPMQYIGDNVHFLDSAFRAISGFLDEVLSLLGDPSAELSALRQRLAEGRRTRRLSFLLEEVPRALAASRDGVAHVAKITRAMKSFGNYEIDAKTQHDINRTLQDTLTVSQNEYRDFARIETDYGELPAVWCYPARLNQAFLNLIVNAAQAIEAAKKHHLGRIGVASRATDTGVEVRISDDGCGIPESIRHRVFDQFFTTRPVGRGSGQGLSLARSIIVDAHHGSLSFDSEAGAGTTFSVCLPLGEPAELR